MTGLKNILIQFLRSTAWDMDAPEVGGAFHIGAVFLISSAAVILALMAARIGSGGAAEDTGTGRSNNSGDAARIRLIGILGWIMAAGELYKQLFYFYIVNDGAYDWWFFPFQLCSVPMYMCILIPFIYREREDAYQGGTSCGVLCSSMLTFMCGFTFVSAVSALAWPEDMMRPYVTLTLHGFIWHGILLFISVMIGLSGMADLTVRGWLRSAVLFLVLCAAATAVNLIAEPLAEAHPVYTAPGFRSYPNMFYISPYHMSNQPVVCLVEEKLGRPAAIAAYITGIILLAGAADYMFRVLACRRQGH